MGEKINGEILIGFEIKFSRKDGTEDDRIFYFGNRKLGGEKVFLEIKNYNMIGIVALSRSGKSALVKQIVYKLVSDLHRKVLVLDPFSEWEKTDSYNFNVNYPNRIHGLKKVKNFALKISQMKKRDYWRVLGFTQVASEIAEKLAVLKVPMRFKTANGKEIIQNEFWHEDNPDKFFQIISELPKNYSELNSFHSNYPWLQEHIPAPIMAVTAQATAFDIQSAKYFFLNQEDEYESRFPVQNPVKLLEENNCVVFSYDLETDDDSAKARSILATCWILDQFTDKDLMHLSPFLVCEEADYIMPNNEISKTFNMATYILRTWMRKYAKFNVSVMWINQESKTIDDVVFKASHKLIYGKVDKEDWVNRLTDTNLNRFLEKRVFALIDREKRGNFAKIFRTVDCQVQC